jgi:hypothetical protein
MNYYVYIAVVYVASNFISIVEFGIVCAGRVSKRIANDARIA